LTCFWRFLWCSVTFSPIALFKVSWIMHRVHYYSLYLATSAKIIKTVCLQFESRLIKSFRVYFSH
jgi:hypothetical protein